MVVWLMLPGCILVRTTDHRIRVNTNGTGEAVLRLIDLRSDGTTDSAIATDVVRLVSMFNDSGPRFFEQNTRTIQHKQFLVQGDTLSLEIGYGFQDLTAIEGLRITPDILYLVVEQPRDIVKTNGRIEPWLEGSKRIVWDRDATRIFYTIRERFMPQTVPLAKWYRGQAR
jgi:hypothetical protein